VRALDSFVIDGIRHNIPFLASLMQSERWRSGRLSTSLIRDEYPNGFVAPAPGGETAFVLAAVATAIDHVMNLRKRQISGQMRAQRAVAFERRRVVMLGEQRFEVTIEESEDAYTVRFEEVARALDLASDWVPGELVWNGIVGEAEIAVQVRPILNGFHLTHRGMAVTARVYTRREAELAALMPAKQTADTSKVLACPMPGLVKEIAVREGQDVKAGEPLAVVEAMKMENVLRAERDVTVKKIVAKVGDSLAVDTPIMEFA
jgi:propionyl-CoA carboxylase alpha chain